jgi:hypothetical protein
VPDQRCRRRLGLAVSGIAAPPPSTRTDTALIDVNFDLSMPAAAAPFADVVAQSNLDNLLTRETNGVTLNQAKLTHDINRKGTVGRLLLYQIDAQDKVTVENRATSQLSVPESLKVAPGQPPQLDSSGSIAYEMRQVKADMRPLDLEARTTAFIHQYLGGLFSDGDASIRSFE